MDPNETLRQLREAIVAFRACADGDSNDAEIEAGQLVADLFEDLDGWLTTGGYCPAPWGKR